MFKHDIVTRLRNIDGFGWQCGQPLKDKGTTFRCSCGCSQVGDDWDGNLSISQPAILREAADEIERIRKENEEMRQEICGIYEMDKNGINWLLNEIKRLKKERDDVRLEVCKQLTKNGPARLTDKELVMLRDWGWLAHMEVK